jgi:CubicO group peptidase (beta-lactamase class C family)
MKAITCAVGILIVLSAFSSGHCQIPMRKSEGTVEGTTAEKLDLYLQRIKPFGFSGAVMVVRHGEIVLNKGYGLAQRVPPKYNTFKTVFSTGSITKQFTAAAIMTLEMQGKLKTTDRIGKYLDGVPADKEQITLHNLLTHTSGLPGAVGEDFEKIERDEYVARVLAQPLAFQPGDDFLYSNCGYSLLAAVIEIVSGQGYEEYLHEHLFVPAGMTSTGYRIPDWDTLVVAHWYVGDTDNGTPLEKDYPYWNLIGNGGILSTTGDMYRWHQALMGKSILSAEAKTKLYTPFLNDYAYGWDHLETERGTVIRHNGGSTLGSSADFIRYIDGNVVIIMFFNQSYGPHIMVDVLSDKIERLVFGEDVPMPPAVIPMVRAGLQRFAGVYRLPSGGTLELSPLGETLTMQPHGQDAINVLMGVAPDTYADVDKQSEAVMQAFLNGDKQPLENVLYNVEARREPVFKLIESQLEQNRKFTGAITGVHAVRTTPGTLRGEPAALTIVRLEGETGDLCFRLWWRDGMNVGVGPAPEADAIHIPVMPQSRFALAGYEFNTTLSVTMKLHLAGRGIIAGLGFETANGEVVADKIAIEEPE